MIIALFIQFLFYLCQFLNSKLMDLNQIEPQNIIISISLLYILQQQIFRGRQMIKYPLRWRKQLTLGFQYSKDFQILNLEQAKQTGIAIILLNDPPGSPFEGFALRLQYPGYDIPYLPPKVKFLDIPWSPFVCPQSGQICCDIFNDQWSPACTIHSVVMSIISLLSQNQMPAGQSGLNMQAAAEMKHKYSVYFQHARQYTEQNHFKKQAIYKDEEKPPVVHPADLEKQDDKFFEQKDKFMNDPQLKQVYQKKLQKFN